VASEKLNYLFWGTRPCYVVTMCLIALPFHAFFQVGSTRRSSTRGGQVIS
jgi:hypothetical protein